MGVQAILRDIAVTQNFQIQGMRTVLGMNNFDATADCVAEIARMTDSVAPPSASPVQTQAPTGITSGKPVYTYIPSIKSCIFSLLVNRL